MSNKQNKIEITVEQWPHGKFHARIFINGQERAGTSGHRTERAAKIKAGKIARIFK